MACPECPNCGAQMEEESIYGAKVCRCPDCGYKLKPKQASSRELGVAKAFGQKLKET